MSKHSFSHPTTDRSLICSLLTPSLWEFFRSDLCGSQIYSPRFCKIMKWNTVMKVHVSGVRFLPEFQNYLSFSDWDLDEPRKWSNGDQHTDTPSFLNALFLKRTSFFMKGHLFQFYWETVDTNPSISVRCAAWWLDLHILRQWHDDHSRFSWHHLPM